MPDQVPDNVRRERTRELACVEKECRAGYVRLIRGRRLQVLIESPADGNLGSVWGTACRYLPVHLDESPKTEMGDFVDVIAGPEHETGIRGRSIELAMNSELC
jgi:tRNA A37 methylthiotransferase MiaB